MKEHDPEISKLALEIENLKRQNEKLTFEIEDLRSEKPLARSVRRLLPILTCLITVITVPGAVFKYVHEQKDAREHKDNEEKRAREQKDREERVRLDEQAAANERFWQDLKRETAKPFWDKQLALYIEAAEKAAIIATSEDEAQRKVASERFWVLYWGPLAAVEDIGLTKAKTAEIESAMVEFGQSLENPTLKADRAGMKIKALNVAHAVRNAIAPAFDVKLSDLQNLREKQKNNK